MSEKLFKKTLYKSCCECEYSVDNIHQINYLHQACPLKVLKPKNTYPGMKIEQKKILKLKICYECCEYISERDPHDCKVFNLYNDSVGKLFHFLPYPERLKMENVCQKWRHISLTKAWNKVNHLDAADFTLDNEELSTDSRTPQEMFKQIIIRSGTFIKQLVVSEVGSEIMRVISQYCENLQHLNIKLNYYDENDFIEIFNPLKKLKDIKIAVADDIEFSPRNLTSLKTTIEIFDFAFGCYDYKLDPIWRNQFVNIITQYSLLQSLNLREIKLDRKIFRGITRMLSLKHLGLMSCKLPKNHEKINKLVNLESLELERVTNMENKFLRNICISLKNLKKISIKQLMSRKMSKDGFSCLEQAVQLKSLRLCLLKHEIHESIFFQFTNLIKLECCGCPQVNDNAMVPVIKQCRRLEILNVMQTQITICTLESANLMICCRSRTSKKLNLFAENAIIENFKRSNTIISPFLILQHDDLWRTKSRIFS